LTRLPSASADIRVLAGATYAMAEKNRRERSRDSMRRAPLARKVALQFPAFPPIMSFSGLKFARRPTGRFVAGGTGRWIVMFVLGLPERAPPGSSRCPRGGWRGSSAPLRGSSAQLAAREARNRALSCSGEFQPRNRTATGRVARPPPRRPVAKFHGLGARLSKEVEPRARNRSGSFRFGVPESNRKSRANPCVILR